MNGLNGIIISGKVYEAVDAGEEELPCDLCCFNKKCWHEEQWHVCKRIFGSDSYFRFSQELTDKINEKMTDELRNLSWQCLPREARDEIRKQYKIVSKNPRLDRYDSVYLTALENLFGHHNLTSDSEPEEMLMISKQEFQKKYEACVIAANECDSSECAIIADLLEDIFGDKCLPDTTIPSDSTELKSDKEDFAENANCKEPSVQVEPKFKVGDIVKNAFCDSEHLTIIEVIVTPNKVNFQYKVKEYPYLWNECELKPYTEPETKDNMEEKELDIYELLESNDDVKTIYSVVHDAEVEFKLANRYIEFMGIGYYSNGSMYDIAGRCMLYPSRALYEKYPLDPVKAWSIWASERKPRYELKVYYQIAGNNNDDEVGQFNTIRFYSLEEAEQAAEAVKECLEKFHEKISAQNLDNPK